MIVNNEESLHSEHYTDARARSRLWTGEPRKNLVKQEPVRAFACFGSGGSSVMLWKAMSETYFQKGFGLKATVGPALAGVTGAASSSAQGSRIRRGRG